jgi:hypothetical protein
MLRCGQVHLKWMEQHGHMPNGKAEIQQYAMMIDQVRVRHRMFA